jgi:hypothetical protein
MISSSTFFHSVWVHLKMLFRADFHKLLIVCLKMLFRKSTRKQFLCLVAAFLFMVGFNTYSYIMKFHKVEIQKRDLLADKAFKVFFARMRTRGDSTKFWARLKADSPSPESAVVGKAFIYQNNLYVHLISPSESVNDSEKRALEHIYALFNMGSFKKDFFVDDEFYPNRIKIKDGYMNHNGTDLEAGVLNSRHASISRDVTDIAGMLREALRDRRFDAFNSITEIIVHGLKMMPCDSGASPNPYLSRVDSIIPMNYLHILHSIAQDNTTDIIDLMETVQSGRDGIIETMRDYPHAPEIYSDRMMYGDLDIYPRYVPLFAPDLLTLKWDWLLYQFVQIKSELMATIDRLHFGGHYLFSYEKSHILKNRVEKINDDIHSNHVYFYLTDLSMGIAFPFMMSLFAFIHLKTEIAYLLMYKNRIRALLLIFWLLPMLLMLFVKGGLVSGYFGYLAVSGSGLSTTMGFPLLVSFGMAAVAFFFINRWCFSKFTSNNLELYALHKGR